MFEYDTVYFGSHEIKIYNIKSFLNDKGLEGWELVQIIEKPFITEPHLTANYTFYFKRRLK